MNLKGSDEQFGSLSLSEFTYRLHEFSNGTIYIPKEIPEDARKSDYWYEIYNFRKPTGNDIKVEVIASKSVSNVDDDNYLGDSRYYLLKIDEELHIFNDDSNSWGEGDPELKEAVPETRTIYTLGEIYFAV